MMRTSPLLVVLCVSACAEPSYTSLDDSANADAGAPSPDETAAEDHGDQDRDDAPNDEDADDPSPTSTGTSGGATTGSGDDSDTESGVEPDTQEGPDTDETNAGDESTNDDADPDSAPSDDTDSIMTPPVVNGDGCLSSDAIPASFARNCAGCHSTSGALAGSAPNLFAFDGALEQFEDHVRNGGTTMPKFDEDALSPTDVEAIFDYFETEASNDPNGQSCSGQPLIGDVCSGVNDPIAPLYVQADDNEPMLTENDDGSLLLRAGGRVRGRHEPEADFSPFHAQYFENRSYTFIVEDSIPAGGNTVKVTWLPIADASADQVINLRYWYTGDGNVFHTNVGMERIEPLHWEWTADHNARDEREIQIGDRLDFEFGVFYDPEQVEGRTSYYSDTFRYVVGSGKLTPFDAPDDVALSGGDTTIPYIFVEPELYFEQMALNIQGDDAQYFLEGRRLFHTNFVNGEHTDAGNPALDSQAGKAGPLANKTSCADCHEHNGRGTPPDDGGLAETLVFKTYALDSTSEAPLQHPAYGRQLQTLGSDGFDAEGQVRVSSVEQVFTFDDGSEVALRTPSYELDANDAVLSPRLPRPVIGLGLLEAVSEQTLLSFADAEDCNGDGVSGRPNLVPDPSDGSLRIGRFGWKAGKVNVRHQVADALQLDLGVTTSLLPMVDCAGANCTDGTEPELADVDLDRLESYMRLVAVPPRRDTSNESVRRGEDTFLKVGCARCHVPTLTTGSLHPLLELRDQVIHPYTDLLLHDMGEALSDAGAGEYTAAASEWRTPPLWGLGLASTVNGEVHLLHDGRASTPLEAILWHGGEAQSAKDSFAALSSAERADLLAFLDTL